MEIFSRITNRNTIVFILGLNVICQTHWNLVTCLRQQNPRQRYQILIAPISNSIFEDRFFVMSKLPLVINTWTFTEATSVAWETLKNGGSVLDAVESGCSKCEELQCDGTVGYGGSPDENGETTQDAMIMDGQNHNVGAVACLRRIKPAISVARRVMENTKHTILAGDLATDFAIRMGFREESLSTPESERMHSEWKNNSCQPNFWKNVLPDPNTNCGPYKPIGSLKRIIDRYNHDTIGMIVIDGNGRIASGTSSNGARNKIPGRVGDAPIVGAGSYVDKEVGGAAATGDGDVMMRFLPSLITVENMRGGQRPDGAAAGALKRIIRFYPEFKGAIVAATIGGEYGAACHGIPNGFPFSVVHPMSHTVKVEHVNCITLSD